MKFWQYIKKVQNKLTPPDLIALLLICGYIFLAWRGISTMLNAAVLVVVGFYFGAKHSDITSGPTQ